MYRAMKHEPHQCRECSMLFPRTEQHTFPSAHFSASLHVKQIHRRVYGSPLTTCSRYCSEREPEPFTSDQQVIR
jgi:hypothetical protein